MTTPQAGFDPSRKPRVILLTLGERPEISAAALKLRPAVERYCEIVLADETFTADLSQVEADLAIVFGGDGSIMRSAQQMAYRQLPVIGVNFGKLGFLAGLLPEGLEEVLRLVCAGEYRVIEHLMFECRVHRAGRLLLERLGLNEAAVLAGPPFRTLEVQLYVDAELATTYSCDGLIVSTPVGSTAHSLSAGGPILRKDLEAFVISPISPHTLTNRPVVDAAERKYELVVPRPNEGTTLVVDGWPLCQMTAEDRVTIERSQARFLLVEVTGQNYYRTLRDKLGWGGMLKMNGGK
jgi:NAD+ kinase